MTSSETTFNDQELIARWDDYVESMGSVMGEVEHMAQQMRDRIEQLAVTNEALIEESGRRLALARSEGVARVEQFERNEALTAKLNKAVEALDEAVYLLKPDEKDMMRQAGVYRIVTTLAEIKGESHD